MTKQEHTVFCNREYHVIDAFIEVNMSDDDFNLYIKTITNPRIKQFDYWNLCGILQTTYDYSKCL